MRDIADDVRLAVRAAARAPLVTAAALATLALGLGATTAIFSLANAMLLRPLPVRDPHQLVTVTSETALRFGFRGGNGWSYAMWDGLRQRRGPFAGAFAWTLQEIDLSGGGQMQPAQVLFASGGFFSTLGLDAAVGRTFTPDDDVRGGGRHGPVTVISFDTWQRRYAGAAGVIGRQVTIGRAPVTIVGVAPRGFLGVDAGQRFDFAVPLGIEPLVGGPQSIVDSPRAFLLTVMLRRREGQSIAEAQAAAEALKREILGTLASASPRMLEEPVVLVPAATGISDRSRLRQQYEQPIVIVGIIAACVLVVGCLNLANLLLARTAAARADLGIRLALGGSRRRIARLVIAEGALLVGGGAALGLPIALTGSQLLASSLPVPAGPVRLDLSLDWRVAAFGLTAAIVVLALCSLLPAILTTRVAPIEVLKPATVGGARALASGTLVIVQVAVSAVLVLGAGMFGATAIGLARVPLGFDAERLTVVTVDSARIEMRSKDRPAIFDRIVSAAQALPGAGGAAGSIWTPLSGQIRLWTDAGGRQFVGSTPAVFNFVTPGWFAVYGTPIVIGRDFRSDDHAAAARVAIVNEAFVKQGNATAVGQPIDAGPCGDAPCTIVGVAADARYTASPRDPVPPTVYVPLAQSAGRTPPNNARVRVTIRGAPAAPAPSVAAIASALRAVDPRLTFSVQPLAADVARSMAQERLLAALATVFGALALLLAGLGIYGVTSYAVARRRVELAIRSALGANRRSIVALVVGETGRRLGVGLAVGLIAAVWLSQFVTSLLFGVDPISLTSALAVVATLGAVGAVAAWAPARRAARISPTVLFRS